MNNNPAARPTVGRIDRIAWRTATVDDGAVSYGAVGRGRPVVFVHGWGFTSRAYRPAIERLAESGVRVYAPTLPGFAGTTDLPRGHRSLAGYASWLGRFLDAAGIDEPVTLVGHSFGGGVAIQAAHDLPDRVRTLVLVNSIGGGTWSSDGDAVGDIAERPLWDWGMAGLAEAFSSRPHPAAIVGLARDAAANAVSNLCALWQSAHLARTADLRRELRALADRDLPVVVLWGRGDVVIPQASLRTLRDALRNPLTLTVDGNHGWLVVDPGAFGVAMGAALAAAAARQQAAA
ncbi:alpha/beta fold hydrolase [Rhodococcus sp. D2-41]|uniref:Alpha/beta fold hydrolase n=1 Tax=Speluncibacter jeojiensis TaxID=2710754 RepID=A0A9X4M744_9ACTN|nr:alpha/beta fold hydrolase [Rhodococcus sp. D2-41]MDG3009529.1 alpha/beta fold hydrolase [Rhodococcus sp. D2-41]MDG3016458.1 alpha/beta fold hydrolase [Corynebacteriales bacterium D3-21]